jgi:RNA polymerase sigma factor (TIGR02999 family)
VPTADDGQVTRLLKEVVAGNEEAKNALIGHVYYQLHNMARGRMERQRPDHTWGATELVHEVYFQLMNGQHVFTKNRAYFFGAAARAMDQLLRDHARKRKCRPQGHLDPEGPILLDEVVEAVKSIFKVELVDLHDALDKLKATGKHGERWYDVVRLRIWGGLTYQEIAEDLGKSVPTVERDWKVARAWLYNRLKGRRIDD